MYAYSFASRFYKRAPLEALSLQIDLSLLRVARTYTNSQTCDRSGRDTSLVCKITSTSSGAGLKPYIMR